MTSISLWSDQELPSTPFNWGEKVAGVAQPVDFSSGSTFTIEISRNGTIVLTKTTGIVGAATYPNVVVDWAVDEIAALAGAYDCRLIARRTSDSKDRILPGRLALIVTAAPVPAV